MLAIPWILCDVMGMEFHSDAELISPSILDSIITVFKKNFS